MLLATCGVAPLAAQQRRYLIEVGAAGSYLSFDSKTNLDASAGGVGRVGLWLPYHLSIEGEAGFYSPKAKTSGFGWNAKVFGGSLLENIPVGSASSVFLRAGYGVTKYDSNQCTGTPPRSIFGACGSSGAFLAGAGFRLALGPTVMLRVEGLGSHASGSVTNVGASAGLSLMLGSKPLTDADQDRVYDIDDHCPNTPLGALVDSRGCPTDTDHDGVFDGLDRCPTTPAGARVNEAGCPQDEDADNVPDGLDKCPGTPAGAAVDATGCPSDSDKDGVADGLDRCPATPAGASVDQLGCPGDEDGDRVLDGLDRCPRTPPGTTVNAFGCPPGVPPGTEGDGSFRTGWKQVIAGVAFAPRSARLPDAAKPALDSLASAIQAHPDVTLEIAAHGDGTAQETRTLTQLRAEAVRRYLISKGVPLQRLVAKGYGNAEPLTSDTGPAARDRNRRIEVRVLPPAQ